MDQPRAGDRRSGFSLIEVMLALAIFAGAFLALAQCLGNAAHAARQARRASIATALAAQKVEQWRSLAWGYDLAGREREDTGSDASRWPDAPAGGLGLALSPADSLSRDSAGFGDYLDEAGAWLGASNGSGASPPPGTAFIRRWSIDAVGGSPAVALVFRVVVLRREAGGPPGAAGRSGVEIARVVSVRTRRAS